MRADQGTQGLRDGAGEEEVRPGQWFFQVVLEPLLGCMMLPRWAVAVATGMMDAVLPSTVLALREAVAVMAAWAMLHGANDLAGWGGESGRALQGLRGQGVEDSADGGHGRSPCLRALR